MASQWFVRGGGKVYGPLDDKRLRSLAVEGKINETTDVATQASGPWHPAGRVRGLFTSSTSSARSAMAADPAPAPMAPTAAPVSGDVDPSQRDGIGAVGLHDGQSDEITDNARSSTAPAVLAGVTVTTRPRAVRGLAMAAGLLLLFAAATSFLGVGQSLVPWGQSTVSGSVFIVKASGESVRLGLTDVYVVPTSKVSEQIVSELKDALDKLGAAEFSIDYNSRPSPIDRAFSSPAVAQAYRDREILEASGDRAKALGRLGELRAALVQNALRQTKTDADGDFQILVPNTPATSIVTYASRKIGAHSEHYFWIIPSEDAKKQQPITQHRFCKSGFSEVGHLASMFR